MAGDEARIGILGAQQAGFDVEVQVFDLGRLSPRVARSTGVQAAIDELANSKPLIVKMTIRWHGRYDC